MTDNLVKDIIKDIIKDMVDEKELFTSIDVSNIVKSQGVWMRNRHVSFLIKDIFKTEYDDYISTQIKVKSAENNNLFINAWLYHHKNSDPTKYTNNAGKPITPSEFKQIVSDINEMENDSIELDVEINLNKEPKKTVSVEKIKDNEDCISQLDDETTTKSIDIKDDIEIKPKFSKSSRNYSNFKFVK